MLERWADLDKSGSNPSRVCYESYDPEIYVNLNTLVWSERKKKVEIPTPTGTDNTEGFSRLAKWLEQRGDSYVQGNRNNYLFKLASASNRFGIDKSNCISLLRIKVGNSISEKELLGIISKAYKDGSLFGTAQWVEGENKTRKAAIFSSIDVKSKEDYDHSIDIVRLKDVEAELDSILDGTKDWGILKTGFANLDPHFKWMPKEVSLFHGVGNHGKSTIYHALAINLARLHGIKTAIFTPENKPAAFFFEELMRMYLKIGGQDVISPAQRKLAKDFVMEYFTIVDPARSDYKPKKVFDTMDLLVGREGVRNLCIDPFNQLDHDWSSQGREDQYLSSFLSETKKFAQETNTFLSIIAHPKTPRMDKNGQYPMPSVHDISGGSMWNNKMDNILCWFRPYWGDPAMHGLGRLVTQKIKKQRIVGSIGEAEFNFKGYWFEEASVAKEINKVIHLPYADDNDLEPSEGCPF